MYKIKESVVRTKGDHFITIDEVQDNKLRSFLLARHKALTTHPGYVDHTREYYHAHASSTMTVVYLFISKEHWQDAIDKANENFDEFTKLVYEYKTRHELEMTHEVIFKQIDDLTLVI